MDEWVYQSMYVTYACVSGRSYFGDILGDILRAGVTTGLVILLAIRDGRRLHQRQYFHGKCLFLTAGVRGGIS